MSIALPPGLPARQVLLAEGIDVPAPGQLLSWGRRPLRLCLVNLMPNKPAAEIQIARLLGATTIPVELTLCLPDGYRSRSMPAEHMAFYRPWQEIRHESFDGLVMTGAPIEMLEFEAVNYWPGVRAIFDWARSRATSSLFLCWAAQAALYHHHGVAKHSLPRKLSGVFRQRVSGGATGLLTGFSEEFAAPVSRHTEVRAQDLPAEAGLVVRAASQETGLCLVQDRRNRAVYMFNHLEYDAGTLADEFRRDRQAGKPVGIPCNYFPGDDLRRLPTNVWRPYGHLLFANWLGEMSRNARPRVSDEPVVQWALVESRTPVVTAGSRYTDLLVAASASKDVLPAALRVLGEDGIAPRMLKVHRASDSRQLIEIRADCADQRTIERIQRKLCALSAVSRVAFRTCAGAGGWLIAHHTSDSQAANAGNGGAQPRAA